VVELPLAIDLPGAGIVGVQIGVVHRAARKILERHAHVRADRDCPAFPLTPLALGLAGFTERGSRSPNNAAVAAVKITLNHTLALAVADGDAQ
jgi:hypothetical protein